MRNCSARILGAVAVALVCMFAGVAQAQRRYVEARVVSTGTATGLSAFANQLAPDPMTGMCLQYDVGNRVVWGPCGNLPPGTPGQVAGVVAGTATQTVSLTGTQTGTGTQTHTYATTNTGTITGTQTATGATGTYTYTATSTLTSIASVESFSVGIAPTAITSSGNGSVLYVLGETKMERYSVASNPLAPSYLGETSLYGDTNIAACMSEDGSYVFAGSYNRVQIFTSAGSYVGYAGTSSSKTPTGCAVKSNRLYVTLGYSGNAQIQTFDISTIGSPVSLGVVNSRSQPVWGADISGTNLFGAGLNRTLEVFSISDPNSPSSLGYTSAGTGSLYDLALIGTKAVLADYSADKLVVVDITTPSAPSYVTNFTVGDQPAGIVIRGNYAYVCHTSLNACRIYDASMYGSPITVTATQTTTGTKTVTNTLTNATTGTNTGTQTYSGTSTFTASATGIGIGTSTAWQAVDPPASSALGHYYLFAFNCEGSCLGSAKLEDFTNGSGLPPDLIENRTVTASCSSGSDGLIGDFTKTTGSEPYPVWAGGMWAANLRASSTGPAAIRIEVWDNTDGLLFTMTTGQFSGGPNDVRVTSLQPARRPSTSNNRLYFRLYAVCTGAASVSFYSSRALTSWIESPLHSDKQDSQNVFHNGSTVYQVLWDLESKPRTTRSVFFPATAFMNYNSLTLGTIGSGQARTQHYVFPDGADSAVQGLLWQRPADCLNGNLTIRPLWIPLTTDANWTHRVAWEVMYASVNSWRGTGINNNIAAAPYATGADWLNWDGDTAFSHYSTDGFTPTAIMLESGGTLTPTVSWQYLRISIGRNHSTGGDTYVGNVGFVGLQIDYPSIL